jgi:glutamate racemase
MLEFLNEVGKFMKTSDNRIRVGFFDSGRGGMSIAQAAQTQLSGLEIVYLPDNDGFPYSNKSGEYIQTRVLWGVDRLRNAGCEAVVLACNTATLYGVELARQRYPDFPIIGTVPALKPALESAAEQIWLLVTESASKSEKLQHFVSSFEQSKRIHVLGLTPLVEAIEADNQEQVKELLQELVQQYSFEHSAVVLGCTHFPLALQIFQEVFPISAQFFSPTQGVIDQMKRVLSLTEVESEPSILRFIS